MKANVIHNITYQQESPKTPQDPVSTEPQESKAPTAQVEAAKIPVKRGRKPKAEKSTSAPSSNPVSMANDSSIEKPASPAPEIAKAEAPAAAAQSSGDARLEMKMAMEQVVAKHGTGVLRDILQKVGAARMSEIKDDQVAGTIALCQEQLK